MSPRVHEISPSIAPFFVVSGHDMGDNDWETRVDTNLEWPELRRILRKIILEYRSDMNKEKRERES